LLYIGLQFEQ